jgi:hypothetical protein
LIHTSSISNKQCLFTEGFPWSSSPKFWMSSWVSFRVDITSIRSCYWSFRITRGNTTIFWSLFKVLLTSLSFAV